MYGKSGYVSHKDFIGHIGIPRAWITNYTQIALFWKNIGLGNVSVDSQVWSNSQFLNQRIHCFYTMRRHFCLGMNIANSYQLKVFACYVGMIKYAEFVIESFVCHILINFTLQIMRIIYSKLVCFSSECRTSNALQHSAIFYAGNNSL